MLLHGRKNQYIIKRQIIDIIMKIVGITVLEIFLVALFLLAIFAPYEIPASIGVFIDSSLGMIVFFIITLGLFVYFHPIVGVVYLGVAYELIRRSSLGLKQVPIIEYTPTQEKKDAEMKSYNQPKFTSLEEEMVAKRAPDSIQSTPVETTFKPVAQNIQGSLYV